MDGGFPLREPATVAISVATPFELFFREHYDFVWRNVRRLGVSSAHADDAAQDVFVTAHRRRRQLRVGASERAWLYTILRRVAFRYRRTEARRRRKLDALETVAPSEHLDRTADAVDARRFMGGFLDGLGDKRRPVFVMIELEGMSAPEVADALGLKVNTVYSRLRLGRASFEREIQRLRSDERASERVVAEARAGDEPPVGAAAAAWLLVDPRVAHPAGVEAAAAWSSWSQAAVFISTVVIGSAGLAGVWAIAPPESAAAAPAAVLSSPVEDSLDAAAAAAEPDPGPQAAVEAQPVSTDVHAAIEEHPAPRSAAAKPRGRVPAGIDKEARLLKRAQRSLADGRPDLALDRLVEHAHEYPGSPLSDVRDAMRIVALCRTSPATARIEAASFGDRHPQSRLLERVRSACPSDGSRGGQGWVR